MAKPANPPFILAGSKWTHRELHRLIPQGRLYCEPFCGTASVFFLREPSPIEVLNDINCDIVNFFSVLRDERKGFELQRRLYYTPFSRAVFEEAKRRCSEPIPREVALEGDLERAYWWFVRTEMSINGYGQSFRVTRRLGWSPPVASFRRLIASLHLYADRLRNAIIECLDYADVCRKYDCEDGVFYLDPPYYAPKLLSPSTTRGAYGVSWGDAEYERLLGVVTMMKGAVVISGYDCHWFDALVASGWERVEYERRIRMTTSALRTRPRVREVVVLNLKAVEMLREQGLDLRSRRLRTDNHSK